MEFWFALLRHSTCFLRACVEVGRVGNTCIPHPLVDLSELSLCWFLGVTLAMGRGCPPSSQRGGTYVGGISRSAKINWWHIYVEVICFYQFIHFKQCLNVLEILRKVRSFRSLSTFIWMQTHLNSWGTSHVLSKKHSLCLHINAKCQVLHVWIPLKILNFTQSTDKSKHVQQENEV